MKIRPLAIGLAVLILAVGAHAQSFNFPNFASTANLALNGSTLQVGSSLRMTSSGNETGTIFHTNLFPVLAGFDTTFTFRILYPPGAILGEGIGFMNSPGYGRGSRCEGGP